ncbi:MAG: DNA primase [Candidatus Omnitrophica bacterium]|nr:DNA primase [Candidatus Omnitrophota bacterium]
MPLIPEHLIDEIQSRTDIAELIGRYVPLKLSGRHFKANCPFHREKTPSFMVNPAKQIFHCFGCGVGGNVFSFLMQHDRLSFPEAVRQLADHAGVSLPEPSEQGKSESTKPLAELLAQTCEYFERLLQHPQHGQTARAYLAKRGVTEPTQRAFRLGVAPSGWRGLLTAAEKRGVTQPLLEASGLIVKGPKGTYDRFRDRLIFPIMDVRGRIVGFGGRSLDAQEPKYLNSPETALYRKGQHLFGLAQAKEAILREQTAVLVEGYFDCVLLAQEGIAHVVSPLGTALTVEQAALLKRYAPRAILAFDPDAAGETATLRGIDVLVEQGLEVRIARLPAGVDPDECLRSMGRPAFEALLARSMSVFDMLIETAISRCDVDHIEGKVQAAQFVLPTIAKVPDAMLRSEYLRLLAERLALDESAVATELAKSGRRLAASLRMTEPERQPAASRRDRSMATGAEQLLTALIIEEPQRLSALQGRLSLEEIRDAALRRILIQVSDMMSASGQATAAQVMSRLTDAEEQSIVAMLVELAQTTASKEGALEECIRRIGAKTKQQRIERLQEQLRSAEASGRHETVQQLLSQVQELVHHEEER